MTAVVMAFSLFRTEKTMLPEKVKKLINEYDMIKAGDRIVAGVSGGADSVCLFHVLRLLREEWGIVSGETCAEVERAIQKLQ